MAARTAKPVAAATAAPGPGANDVAVARLFELMADVLEIRGDNVFRVRAYRRAAQNLRSLAEDVATLAREERLDDVPGVGADLAGKITEYLATGHVKEIDAACRRVPAGVVELMSVPGVGPRTAKLLYERYHVTGLQRLGVGGPLLRRAA